MRTKTFQTETRPSDRWALLWGLLTVLILLGVACLACVFVLIFINPYTPFNPFPPPTLPAPASLPSDTPTLALLTLPPTWTPTATPLTPTPSPTFTLPPTPTPLTLTPTPTPTWPPPPGGYPFALRAGSPKAMPNIHHPELGCNWMGVGGQVLDKNNAPVIGLILRLGGSAPGILLPENTFTLSGVALAYGRSGYEFKLADMPIASRRALWIQLLDPSGMPLSEQVFFDTYASCEQNLILIDFKQVR